QSLVVIHVPERHARPALQVFHLYHDYLEALDRVYPSSDEAEQVVREARQGLGRLLARADDLRGPAGGEIGVQLAVQCLEVRHVRAEVDADADRDREVSDDLVGPGPDPRLSERLALRDRLQGSFEVLARHRGVRPVDEGLEGPALIPEMG